MGFIINLYFMAIIIIAINSVICLLKLSFLLLIGQNVYFGAS